MELDPVLEVQDDVVTTVLLSHLLPLKPVRHFLQSHLSIGQTALPRKDHALLTTGLSPFWGFSSHDELWEMASLVS